MADHGGAAYPNAAVHQPNGSIQVGWEQPGMTLRQWYAGTYAAGLARYHHVNPDAEEIAILSYKVADALIKEGNK